ncbi:hypothetical protein ABB37_06361 [Leptomonas pyrrhocoris]|uniref:NTF2-like domain-containing protein n=1 Tax=Leptomonas pyrrhocoris TaxID=157538 RepID=A0A0M9FXX2_LEPPY|nr:hypothetical protein ABB37_06361 [Leptomonas pyrrhocoris]KPA78197.1 hypothetical protein ABB37_06361 [Leptomonas pyrrhocoris]|eukprot:XP_015656636.1 hypothetical protein ABB37_06361 [Leptomonas pyrrhocoris]
MSYSGQKLKFFVDDSDGWLRKNKKAADQFIMAEDDGETREMLSLMTPRAFFGSFWGVVRGLPAAVALRAQENDHLRLTWTSGLQPLTSHTFVRQGFVHVVDGKRITSAPIIGPWLSSFFQKPVHEYLVVREGRVTFRSIGYTWDLGKY